MLATIKLIIQLIPYILELIKVVESQIPEQGQGKAKLAFIRDVLEDSFPDVKNIWDLVEKIISSAVTLYNTTGVFKKKDEA